MSCARPVHRPFRAYRFFFLRFSTYCSRGRRPKICVPYGFIAGPRYSRRRPSRTSCPVPTIPAVLWPSAHTRFVFEISGPFSHDHELPWVWSAVGGLSIVIVSDRLTFHHVRIHMYAFDFAITLVPFQSTLDSKCLYNNNTTWISLNFHLRDHI